ncbi:MAG TPA: amylo-alpha-1,6-glucosidase [Syntrophales bacterium]|nr:amylo-alpha-1,6-glucosidase [Syntrophales bacterium]
MMEKQRGIDCPETGAYAQALRSEWLEVNGRGGYASSTLLNCHTRKYHGLLVSHLAAPPGRYVLLSKFEDTVAWGARREALSCHRYPGDFFPADYSFLRQFRQDLFPTFLYEGGGVRVRKSLLLIAGTDSLLVRYDPEMCPATGVLRLRPFLAFRDYHSLSRENPFLRGETTAVKNGFAIRPYAGMPTLVIQTNLRPRWQAEPFWYRNFEYAEEGARGYEHHEDLFTPGILEVPLRKGKTVFVLASFSPFYGRLGKKWDDEVRRRRREAREDDLRAGELLRSGPMPDRGGDAAGGESTREIELLLISPDPEGSGAVPAPPAAGGLTASAVRGPLAALPVSPGACRSGDPEREVREDEGGAAGPAAGVAETAAADRRLLTLLLQAGRRFLIRTPAGHPAIIAGYPWFGAWGRDTLISLPGLTFCSGRRGEGRELLVRIAGFERHGLLPNVFSERDGNHAYNTVDAPLWFFWAVQQLLRDDDGDGTEAVVEKSLWPVMKGILRQFIHGTIFNIYMDDNGLLHAGAADRALTWMDACCDGRPVTPRHGYPVEINALWYNAVCCAAELAARFGDREFYFDDLRDKIRRSFQETFWSDEDACLGDVYRDGHLDRSIRPNQLFAVSLPHSPLERAQGRLVVEKVRDELLTPVGLRTLSPRDPRYRGRYEGPPAERDSAYHQGTVWPWLLGAFGEAWLKTAADRDGVQSALRDYLRTFLARHFREGGMGCIAEVFDGDAPHRPGGCIAQAWSTAELIRLSTLVSG